MHLTLGTQSFDLTTRALVVGTVEAAPSRAPALVSDCAQRLVAEGADVVEVLAEEDEAIAAEFVAVVVARVAVPVAIASSRWQVLAAGYAAGAVLGSHGGHEAESDFLRASAAAGASVILPCPPPAHEGSDRRPALMERARRAEAAGIPRQQIVVEPVVDRRLLRAARRVAELGYPVLLTVSPSTLSTLADEPGRDPDDDRALALAATALAVTGGWRLVRTSDVKGVRRVCRVLAAVLEAGDR
ncbi:MAG: hypothetical protein ABR540_01550 [Acidimicrobiales bacterium]